MATFLVYEKVCTGEQSSTSPVQESERVDEEDAQERHSESTPADRTLDSVPCEINDNERQQVNSTRADLYQLKDIKVIDSVID